MHAKPLALVAALSVAALASAADPRPEPTAAPVTRKPNIVLVLADDFGFGDAACYDPQFSKIPTPNIDRLAREGVRFTEAHSSSAVCTPTRYGLSRAGITGAAACNTACWPLTPRRSSRGIA
jgi:arylsulfatase A